MEAVVASDNMQRAYRKVIANQGAPGADGMTVQQLADHLKQHWSTLRERLLAGEYHPSPIRAVEIPKPKGGTRRLGIPTVTDRLIQQALLQVLTPIFDPSFYAMIAAVSDWLRRKVLGGNADHRRTAGADQG
jgi:RNA-directed DNA polymerase